MFSFSMPELMVILAIALVVFGPGKLPELGKALGRGMQEFRKATSGEMKEELGVADKIEEKKVIVEMKPEEKK